MKKIEEKYFKNPESYIPEGDYCYNGKGVCPFWDVDEKRPEQENGYCHYMKKGDWDINAEGGTIYYPATGEKEEVDYFPFGLIWDQVKECEIKKEMVEEE